MQGFRHNRGNHGVRPSLEFDAAENRRAKWRGDQGDFLHRATGGGRGFGRADGGSGSGGDGERGVVENMVAARQHAPAAMGGGDGHTVEADFARFEPGVHIP